MSKPGDNKGIKNIKAKLSEADVLSIYKSSGMTQQSLAQRYGVTQSTINHIKTGRTWSWLTKNVSKS